MSDNRRSFIQADARSAAHTHSTSLELQRYPAERRLVEAKVKTVFGFLNGVGWGVGLVAIATLAGISLVGILPLAVGLSAGGLGLFGGLASAFRAGSRAEAANLDEQRLVSEANLKLIEIQAQQWQILKFIEEALAMLPDKLNAFLRAEGIEIANWDSLSLAEQVHEFQQALTGKWEELSAVRQLELRAIVNTLQTIQKATDKLLPINISADDTITERAIGKFKERYAVAFASALTHPAFHKVVTDEKSIKQTYKASVDKSIVVAIKADEPATTLFNKIKEQGHKVWEKLESAGAGFGLAAGVGTVIATIVLGATPPLWPVVIAGVAIIAAGILCAGISMFVMNRANRSQEKNMANVSALKSKLHAVHSKQKKVTSDLYKNLQALRGELPYAAELRAEQQRKLSVESRLTHKEQENAQLNQHLTHAKTALTDSEQLLQEQLALNAKLAAEKKALEQELASVKKEKVSNFDNSSVLFSSRAVANSAVNEEPHPQP